MIARLGKPNGLDGFIGLYVDDADLSYFQPGSEVMIGGVNHAVRAVRRGKKGPQVAFEAILDRAGAEAIRGSEVRVGHRRALTDHEYWPTDLIGLEVRPGGGVITAVNHGPSQDRLVIRRDEEEFEVPFVDELVPVVDLESGYVEIVEIPGLSGSPGPG